MLCTIFYHADGTINSQGNDHHPREGLSMKQVQTDIIPMDLRGKKINVETQEIVDIEEEGE